MIEFENSYTQSADLTLFELQTDGKSGLTVQEHAIRLKRLGPNVLPEDPKKSLLVNIWEQVNSVVVYILFVGAAFSFGFEHHADGIVILAVVVVNTILGVFMETKAGNATEALKGLIGSTASVIRNGTPSSVSVENLTVGDIFFLYPGDVVPADGRIVSCAALVVSEAALTGESKPITKSPESLPASTPMSLRKNMVFAGAQVLEGTATCVVVSIGKDCEVGKIGQLLGSIHDGKTPLMQQVDRFGLALSVAIILLAILAAGISVVRGYQVADSIAFAVGIAVAATPEGLPSCVMIAFAAGVRTMAKQHALVKSLPFVEVLSSVDVICSDKTGTLTMNQMHVMAVVPAPLSANEGEKKESCVLSEEQEDAAQLATLLPGIICNAAKIISTRCDVAEVAEFRAGESQHPSEYMALDMRDESDRVEIMGNPTEAALLRKAMAISSPAMLLSLRADFREELVIPFDSKRKFMAVFGTMKHGHKQVSNTVPVWNQFWESSGVDAAPSPGAKGEESPSKRPIVLLVKGSPEKILGFCDLSPKAAEMWQHEIERLGAQGMRVLALASRLISQREFLAVEDLESNVLKVLHGCRMTCVVGIMDPPRPELRSVITSAYAAGITVKMITGDHPITAKAISRMIGLRQVDRAVTGSELDVADDATFDALVLSNDVFARTMPQHKYKIVQSLQRHGHVCCMTGDGVNDAPALKAADLGVAMGKTGNAVAKDAAKMIITDDNFATIVNAVACGRCTYANIVRVLSFALPTNAGQAFSIIWALIIGIPVPITALQILWINTVTSIALGLVLVFEPPKPATMSVPPRNLKKSVFGKYLRWRLFLVSTLITICVLLSYQWESTRVHDAAYLETVAVNTLCSCQIFYLFNCRYRGPPPSLASYFTGNPLLYVGILCAMVFQVIFTYLPSIHSVFHTAPIDAISWLKVMLFGALLFSFVEFEKYLWFHAKQHLFLHRDTANNNINTHNKLQHAQPADDNC